MMNPVRVGLRGGHVPRLATCVAIAISSSFLLTGVPARATVSPNPTPVGDVPNPFTDGAAGSYAWGAATMGDGSVVVGDIWNRRVLHYDTSGNLLGVLFAQTRGDAPYGLGVDRLNGTVYVGRASSTGVERWIPNAVTHVYFLAGILHSPDMVYPSRVAVADDGTVYIADMLADKIFVFSGSTHMLLSSFGSRGHSAGQFIQPRGLAFDGSNPQRLYIMDAYNERVEVFDPSGNYLFQFGSKGTLPGQFRGENTRGLTIDRAHGWVFVVDIGAGVIDKFDLAGNFLLAIGSSNTSQFPPPLGTFSQGGREVTIDGAGHLWVGDMPDFRVQVFDGATGQPLMMRPDPAQLPPDGAFNDPRGLTLDSQGNLYVADTHNFRVEKFDSSGNFLWAIGSRGRSQLDNFAYSRNMASDPLDSSFYLADTYNNAIDHFDTNGTLIWRASGAGNGPGEFAYPSGVGVGPDRNVYIADSHNQRIQVLDHQTGAFVRYFSCTPCNDPRGVAVDPTNGNIYVADMNAALIEFNNAGTYVAALATKGTGVGQLSTASDVAVDSKFIYVADGGADQVKIWSLADGSFVTGFRGTQSARMRLPSAVAINPLNGRLFVAEEYNDRVSEWCISSC